MSVHAPTHVRALRPPADHAHATPPQLHRGRLLWAASLLLFGATGMTAAWVVLGLWNSHTNGWMALLAGLDMAWMLRLGRWPAGRVRGLTAAVATLAIALAANWGTAASQVALDLGMDPLRSAARLGPDFALTLLALANGPLDALAILAGLVVAYLAAR